ncbi:MAG: hypothetical protein GY839_13135 [candidate division Zixibacteria bacterium]|nr:hypothetical protein [candidate division Zixibacteria bacterium]
MIKRIIFGAIIIVVVAGCGRYRHIIPDPQFEWPEMASSKISDSLGIYIPADNLKFVLQSRNDDKCCRHKNIHFGEGARKALKSASEAVFRSTVMLGKKPTDTYIKSLGVRGVLHLKDISTNVEFIPYIESEAGADNISLYNIKVSLSMNISAIDLSQYDIREFNIDVESESNEAVPRKKLDKSLRQLVDIALEKAADYLARELINIYGARA